MIKRRSTLIGKQANLFTTNMDLFLDKTLEDLNLEYNDGFSGKLNPTFSTSNYRKSIFQKSPHYENQAEIPLFNLFKLHGSVTWKAQEDKIIFDKNLSILNDVKKTDPGNDLIIEFNHENGEPKKIKKLISDAVNYQKSKKVDAFLSAYSQMVIINPTKDKFSTTTTQYTFYELLRMYSNELEKENSVLFVFGFSFADEHIREITKRVANSNPTLLVCVFAYDLNAKNDIASKLVLTDFKFNNLEIIIAGSFLEVNKVWFSNLARQLDTNQYPKESVKEETK